MTRRPRFELRKWLVRAWHRLPFVRHGGGEGLAGVREPRRPRPPFRPPLARAAKPDEEFGASPVMILSRPARRWWRRRPRAQHG
ncbi:MAG TPA: hypothetical protein VKU77_09025 [Streptosporangiaceae bacterium]|nr:hypothetical protein [Streptosporangiaceae bacterium]